MDYPDGTRTAVDAAAAIGCSVGQIVKSLVFTLMHAERSDEVVIALVSGTNQLDERKLAVAAGARKASRADAEVVRTATGYSIGGVPPFGHTQALRSFLDSDLLAWPSVWAAAGTPTTVFCLEPQQLLRVASAVVVELRKGL